MLDRVTLVRAETAAGDGPLLVALSGGGDSTALLHLLVERLGPARLRAIVIDHALRAGSAEDARSAREFATVLGVIAEVVTLAWPSGAKRAQQAARVARYRALCETARRHGARIIAVAHTADDQAETMLMRAAAGSSWRGLAGIAPMAPAPVWPEGRGIVLTRPLLGSRREHLRAFLQARGAAWIDDPANTNRDFERVRVRSRLAALEQAGFDPMRLAALASSLRPRAELLDREAGALIARAARFDGERIVIVRARWTCDAQTRRRALSALLAAAGGAAREADASALNRLEVRFSDVGFRGASLGGARIARAGAEVVLSRDIGALQGRADGPPPLAPLPLAAGIEAVWDGRLAIIAAEPGWSIAVEQGGPRLARDKLRLTLGEAGPVAALTWLLECRVKHLLGLD